MKPPEKGKYSPRKLEKCLSDVRNGVTPSNAARLYNIPRSTISCKINNHRPMKKGKNGPEAALGNDIENQLVKWLMSQARRGFPLSKQSLLFSVTRLISSCFDADTIKNLPFRNGHPGEKWYQSFMKRHPCLVQKRSEYLSLARASNTEERIRQWFQDVLDLLGPDAELLEYPEQIYNVDESAFFLNNNGKVVLAERGKSVYDINTNSEKDNVTVSICVNAIGEMAPPLVVYKYIRLPAVYGSSLPPKWSIGTSETGWMNSETFFEYFANVFIPFVKEKHDGKGVIVFFDGHKSHLSLQVSNLAEENRIQLICLPASTTHFMQPLDVSYFKPLKLYWKKEKDAFEFENKRNIFKYEVPKILQIVFEKYNLNNAMINGFRKCGLFPFDPNNLDYSKCMNQKPPTENTPHPTEKSTSRSILEFFESKIDQSTLRDFRATKNQWHGDEKFAALYDVWKKLLKDDTSYAAVDVDNYLLDIPVTHVTGSVSNPVGDKSTNDFSISSNIESNITGVQCLPHENDHKTDNDEENDHENIECLYEDLFKNEVLTCFNQNTIISSKLEPLATSTPEKDIDEQISNVAQTEDCNCVNENFPNSTETVSPVTNLLKEIAVEPIQNLKKEIINVAEASDLSASSLPEKLLNKSIQNVVQEKANSSSSLKNVNDVLLELTRADFTKKRGRMKASTSKTYPVITSEQWRSLEMSKQKDKEEAEKLKETNRLKRFEKKKENTLKRKNSADFESEEMVDDPEPMPDNITTKRRQKNRKLDVAANPFRQIDNITEEGPKRVGRPKKQKSQAEAQKGCISEQLDIGSWVLVQYNNQKYPGIITKYDSSEEEYEVKTMKAVQFLGNIMWKWPEREERAYYEKQNIMSQLASPEIQGGSGRGAGLFNFKVNFC